ncbi:MAG: type II toxin-antitoxin system death-on-curing family toxin [Balneolales bacterium]|nr:type II toxin-antitoxin system death-on-curing family toxin [Balneolales bacterium]
MAITYLTIEQAVEIHSKTVDLSGGGTKTILNKGPLESVLEHIKNDLYYPEFEDKLTHLFFSACKFHCFQDGNKRIAITLCAQMLLFNGYLYCSNTFLREMENISYHVASGAISKELLREIIGAVIADSMDDESLKLKIIESINDYEQTNEN